MNLVCTEQVLAIGAAGLLYKPVHGLNKGRQRSVWAQLRAALSGPVEKPAFATVSKLDLLGKMYFPSVQ